MRGRGWRAVFCFFSAILWRVPRFLGDRFSVPHGDSVRHPFGIRGRAEPAGACAPPTGGEGTILSHNLLNYVNFIPRKVVAKSFPPMPGICAIRCNRVPRIRVTRRTVLCTTPSSFGMRKLGRGTLWHTVCINKKAGTHPPFCLCRFYTLRRYPRILGREFDADAPSARYLCREGGGAAEEGIKHRTAFRDGAHD